MSDAAEHQRVDLFVMNRLFALSRRQFLGDTTTALAGLGLIDLLAGQAGAAAAGGSSSPVKLHHRPKAKRVLQIFCPGAASHMDLWEYKPALEKWDGKPLPGEEDFSSFQGKNGNLMCNVFFHTQLRLQILNPYKKVHLVKSCIVGFIYS